MEERVRRMGAAFPAILLGLGLSIGLASDEIYEWVDKNGALCYTDYPPPSNRGTVVIKTGDSNLQGARSAFRSATSYPKRYPTKSREADLVRAAKSGDIAKVRELLKQGTDVNGYYMRRSSTKSSVGDRGDRAATLSSGVSTRKPSPTPLMAAATRGHLGIAWLLLERGAGVNVRHREKTKGIQGETGDHDSDHTALVLAARHDHPDVVRMLLTAQPDKRNLGDALAYATVDQHARIVELLLKHGIDTGSVRRALKLAQGKDPEIVRMLQKNRDTELIGGLRESALQGDVSRAKSRIGKGNMSQSALYTSLGKAVQEEDVEDVKRLLSQADQECISQVFDRAIRERRTELAIALLHRLSKDRDTLNAAFTKAVSYQQDKIVDILFPRIDSATRGRALLIASDNGDIDMVKKLTGKNTKLDTRDHNGATPLIRASKRGHQDVVEALIESGANANAQDKKGKSALHWAQAAGHQGISDLLFNAGSQGVVHAGRLELPPFGFTP